MDYTTLAWVKQVMHIQNSTTTDDALLETLITSASRFWDRLCTGVPDATDYFKLEDVTGEKLTGQIGYDGNTLICYPHKPIINSVSSFTYQLSIIETSYTVSGSRIECDGPRVTAYPFDSDYLSYKPYNYPTRCRVTISYNGGLASSVSGLPADMQEAVAIMVARMYREAESGLADQIGVAELTTMTYTKAVPVRVANLAEYYRRRVGWRHVA